MNLFTNGVAADVVRNVAVHLMQHFALSYVAQTVFLFSALLIMTKVQKLKCHPLALLGCAVLACALRFIPVVGIPLSLIVLLLCVTKAVGARTFTDALFAAGTSYALMFCFNLFVLSALLGNLHLSLPVRARTAGPSVFDSPVATNTSSKTNILPVVAITNPKAPSPMEDSMPAAPVAREAQPAPSPMPVMSPNAGKLASDVSLHFTIKGISKSAVQTMAMIGNGIHTYDVVRGDTFQMQTSSGKANAICDSVEDNKVVLEVEGVLVTIQHKEAGTPGIR